MTPCAKYEVRETDKERNYLFIYQLTELFE